MEEKAGVIIRKTKESLSVMKNNVVLMKNNKMNYAIVNIREK